MYLKDTFLYVLTILLISTMKGDDEPMPLMCYYSWDGPETELVPEKIELHLCTHIIVGFSQVVNKTVHLDESLAKVIQRTIALKAQDENLKVLFSIGGGADRTDGFGAAVQTEESRKILIDSILSVIREQKLDGVDFDWEFPAWFTDWRERPNFAKFLKEFRYEADQSGLKIIVTVAASGIMAITVVSYDMTALAAYTDFVNLMTYDYHIYNKMTNPFVGHNSPLFPRKIEKAYFSTLNVEFSAEFWARQGYPRSKLLIGLPFYGHVFSLADPSMHKVDAPASGYITDWDYPTITEFISDGGIRGFDNESMVPYTYLNRTWVTYDDEESLTHKALWLKDRGFGGAMIFSLNCDDWSSRIGNQTFPLLKTVHKLINENHSD